MLLNKILYNHFGDFMEIKVYNNLPEEAINLRIKIFVDEQGFVDEIDDIDNIATHFLLFNEDNRPVATCRIFESEKPGIYILGRLCVLKEYRGKSFGNLILRAAEEEVLNKGGNTLILHSQLHAKAFYEKSGYKQDGPLEYEQDQPHIWMKKEII